MLRLQFISGRLISFWNLFIYVNNSQYNIYISFIKAAHFRRFSFSKHYHTSVSITARWSLAHMGLFPSSIPCPGSPRVSSDASRPSTSIFSAANKIAVFVVAFVRMYSQSARTDLSLAVLLNDKCNVNTSTSPCFGVWRSLRANTRAGAADRPRHSKIEGARDSRWKG